MLRLLPIILIPALILTGLGYWRYATTRQNLESPKINQDLNIVEVPKTLPGAAIEDRVRILEDLVTKLVGQVNSLKSSTKIESNTSLDSKLSNLEALVAELKSKVSVLEKATPAPAAISKSSVYIPLGSGGKWGDKDWFTTQEYEVSLNPDNYPGYTGMVLEATFKLAENSGTGSIRLYNATDGSAISSQLDTTSNSYSLKTSSSFTLPTGVKTYKLQVKSSQGSDLYIQSARIKVNF